MAETLVGLLFWIFLILLGAAVLWFLISQRRWVRDPGGSRLLSSAPTDPWQAIVAEPTLSDEERSRAERVRLLLAEARNMVQRADHFAVDRQRRLSQEIDRLATELLAAFEKLAQLGRVGGLIEQPSLQRQVESLRDDLTREVDRSRAVLEEVVVAVSSIDVRKDQRSFEQLLGDLSDTSGKLRDYLVAYEEVTGLESASGDGV